jgi:Zn-dependent protease with chaperone function
VSFPPLLKKEGGTEFGRGKVFVYTGLFPIAKDRDGLAVILGHEIAHAVAHHSAERLSSWWIVVAGVTALVGLFDGSGRITTFLMNFLYHLPNSRTMEVCLYQSQLLYMFSDNWLVGS